MAPGSTRCRLLMHGCCGPLVGAPVAGIPSGSSPTRRPGVQRQKYTFIGRWCTCRAGPAPEDSGRNTLLNCWLQLESCLATSCSVLSAAGRSTGRWCTRRAASPSRAWPSSCRRSWTSWSSPQAGAFGRPAAPLLLVTQTPAWAEVALHQCHQAGRQNLGLRLQTRQQTARTGTGGAPPLSVMPKSNRQQHQLSAEPDCDATPVQAA